jgi:hypothetical protein
MASGGGAWDGGGVAVCGIDGGGVAAWEIDGGAA